MAPTKEDLEDPFYRGVCCALAVVRGFDQETVWREIVRDCGGYDLLRAVSKHGDNLDIDGFTTYRKDSRS